MSNLSINLVSWPSCMHACMHVWEKLTSMYVVKKSSEIMGLLVTKCSFQTWKKYILFSMEREREREREWSLICTLLFFFISAEKIYIFKMDEEQSQRILHRQGRNLPPRQNCLFFSLHPRSPGLKILNTKDALRYAIEPDRIITVSQIACSVLLKQPSFAISKKLDCFYLGD